MLRIIAIEGERADGAFDGVIVEIEAAIIKEAYEPVPTGQRITDRLAQTALGADLTEPGFEELMQVIDDDAAALASLTAALIGSEALNIAFDDVERGDTAQDVGGNR